MSAPSGRTRDVGKRDRGLGDVARRTVVITAVAIGVAVGVLVLWKARLVVTLLFLSTILAAAMRPGVESLRRRGVPRGIGVALHYLVVGAVLAGLLWLAVPRAIDQAGQAVGPLPTSSDQLRRDARASHGVKRQVLLAIERRLRDLPTARELVRPALDITRRTLTIVVSVFFVLASAAYWIFERDRAERFVLELLPAGRRRAVADTWRLVDLKLGAYMRGQVLLVVVVSVVLSLGFWAIGEPYWILLGPFAGLVELVPVIGPLAAAVLAVGLGLTASWHVAALAAGVVFGFRLVQDYVLVPRVLGDVVGLSPLLVLVTVAIVGVVLGGASVPLAVPLAAVLATVADVVLFDKNPRDQDVPALLFPAKDAE